ncbi:ATP-dependent Clp protease proteolytic subunit OS=Bacillus licheniformis CG-B52 OX=1368424 GN=clpP PE=3 SV=1 [Bacillus licheniformis]
MSQCRLLILKMFPSLKSFLKLTQLKNSEIMIHQPLGGVKGQATDMEISAKRIIKLREKIERFFHERTGQPIEKLKADMERDYFMDADEAKAYGVIDAVL